MKLFLAFISLGFFSLAAQAQSALNTSGADASSNAGSMSYSIGQVFYTQYGNATHSVCEGVQQSHTSDCHPLDSVVPFIHNQGVYQAFFSGLTGSSTYRIEWKSAEDSVWRSKPIFTPSSGQQKFNLIPWFNTQIHVRVKEDIGGGTWKFGCTYVLDVPCKDLILQMVEVDPAFCAGDSSLVRVGYAGGFGAKSILWSNGQTTKFVFADQGEKLTVTVSDAAGCSQTDSITASVINTATSPTDFFVARNAAILTASWNPPLLSVGQTVLFYRVNYRLRGTTTWTTTPVVTDTFSIMDWNGSGIAAGNYEFMVVARINDNGTKYTSEPSCKYVRGYNGVGGKSEGTNGTQPIEVRSISVYPNPTDNILYIQAPENSRLFLVDMHGKTIVQVTSENVETSMDMSHCAQGVYILQILTGMTVETRRIVRH